MKKIESLTPEQEQRLVEYRAKWLAIGRSTEPANRPASEKAITRMYEILGHPKPYFWWSDGPAVGSFVRTIITDKEFKKGANLGANLRNNLGANLGDNLWDNLGDSIRDNLRDNLGDNLAANLWDNLGDNLAANLGDNLWDNLGANLGDSLRDNLVANLADNLGANLRNNLRNNLRDNLWDSLGDNLGDNLWDNLRNNLWANLRANLGDSIRDNLAANLGDNLKWNNWGSHEAYWPAYYNFPDAELRKIFSDSNRERLGLWLTLSEGTGWWEPYKNVVFMCERPALQLVNERGQLHCETGPALLCRDGFPVWALNGVRCKESHVMTSANDYSPTEVMKEENVDIRRELIRKIGVERMLAKLPHKSLNKMGNYELLSVDFPELVQDARYLKMLNPSIGVWHLEGVDRSCKTVQEAINWRAGDTLQTANWEPSQLT